MIRFVKDFLDNQRRIKMYFRKVVLKLLDRFFPESTSTALVPLYIHNGTFSKAVDQGSEIVRFYNYHCACCGQDSPLTVSEARSTKMRHCGCGQPYNLLLSLDLITGDGSLKAEYEYALMNLPNKALAIPQPKAPFIPVDFPNTNKVIWSGPRDDRRTAAFEHSDPEMMGPGFTFPKR